VTLAVLGKGPRGVRAGHRPHPSGSRFRLSGPAVGGGGGTPFSSGPVTLWVRWSGGPAPWVLPPCPKSPPWWRETPLEGESLLDEVSLRLARLLSRWGRRKFLGLRPYLRPRVGFFLAGFETQRGLQGRDRVWDLSEPFSPPPRPVRVETPDTPQCGFNWRGQEIWMTRLILGYDPRLLELIRSQFSLPEEELLPLFSAR
jgi:hypothetical protein